MWKIYNKVTPNYRLCSYVVLRRRVVAIKENLQPTAPSNAEEGGRKIPEMDCLRK